MSKRRNHHKNKRPGALPIENQKRLTWQVLSAVTTAGFLLTPFAAQAAEITDVNGASAVAKTTNGGNGVTISDVYAQKLNNGNAINHFKNFKLDQNDVTNLYFHTKDKPAEESANLVNFVDNRVDINGTVNAIHNKQIGGNLYFLSSEGMAVGKSGVINTGSLYVMTPTNTVASDSGEMDFDTLSDTLANNRNEEITKATLANIQTGHWSVPVNPSGTITILGKVNATGDVKLYAPRIAVGKNITGKPFDDVAADGTTTGAAIETGITDFSNVVRLTPEQQANAGLTQLNVTASGNGDIVFAAKAEYAEFVDKAFEDFGSSLGMHVNEKKAIKASIENYGTLTAAGNVQLTAEATNGNLDKAIIDAAKAVKDGTQYAGDVVVAVDASAFTKTEAEVNVQGNITAAKDVVLKADSDNRYIDNNTSFTDVTSLLISFINPIGVDVGLLESKATVTIGAGNEVKGKNVTAAADANLIAGVGADVYGRKLIKGFTAGIPAPAFTYTKAVNTATVNVEGDLTATGDDTVNADGSTTAALRVTANASSDVDSTAAMEVINGTVIPTTGTGTGTGIGTPVTPVTGGSSDTGDGQTTTGSPILVTSIAVTDHENNATINMKGKATAEKGSVAMNAKAENSLYTSAMTQVSDETALSTAIDVFTHDSTAKVNVSGAVTGQKDVTITANNTLKTNSHIANNNQGTTRLQNAYTDALDFDGIIDEVLKIPIVDKAIDGLLSLFTDGDGTTTSPKTSWDQKLSRTVSVGAAVLVVDEDNTSSVNFDANSVTKAATGSLTVTADTINEDTMLTAAGTANTFRNDDQTSDPTTGAIGVLFGGMNQTAAVNVADGKAVLSAGKDMTLKSNTQMDYNRVNRMIAALDESIKKLEFAIKLVSADGSAEGKEIAEKATQLKRSLEAFQTKNDPQMTEIKTDEMNNQETWEQAGDVASNGADILVQAGALTLQVAESGLTLGADLYNILNNALSVVDQALTFVAPSNYANVSATASARGGQDTKRAISAAVTISDFNYDSHVTIGKDASLTANNALDLEAKENIVDVNVTGKSLFWNNDADAGAGAGVGGSFNYQSLDSKGLVSVAKGATLTAGDIDLASTSDVFHVGAMLSAGLSDGTGITGMAAITDSDSDNQVLVDKDAKITAKKSDTNKTQGTVSLSGYNNTNVNNAILALNAGTGAAAAGMAVAINNIDVTNRAAIEDLDPKDNLNSTTGFIKAAALSADAETTGLINSITFAGGITYSDSRTKTQEERNILDTIGDKIDVVSTVVPATINKGVSFASGLTKDFIRLFNGGSSQGGGTPAQAQQATSQTAPTPGVLPENPPFTLGASGSASVNLETNKTEAIIDGANVQLDNDGNVQAGARDTSFVGAWSGGATMSFRTQAYQGKSAAFSGAVGVNYIDNTLTAAIKNSTLTGVKNLDVEALSGGTAIATGLGVSLIDDSSPGNNFAGGASFSVNLINKDVTALLENDKVNVGQTAKDQADIDVTAYESDLQVTGGINANINSSGGTVAGGSVTVANINNNVKAGINGGTFEDVASANVETLLATKQITSAVSMGVAVGGADGTTDKAFTGAIVYNGLHNLADAAIYGGANVTAAQAVTVASHDTTSSSEEAKPFQDKLGDYSDHEQFAENAGIDTDGSSYYKDTDENGKGLDTAGQAVDLENKGSLSVGAAVVVAVSDDAAGAAVNVADRDIDFSARIDNATIKAAAIATTAEADSLGVDVSAGVAAGTQDFGGVGSVNWQTQANDVLAQVSDATLITDKLAIKADSNAKEVNVAGSVAYGGTAGVGESLAYNKLSNQIHAYLAGGSLQSLTAARGVDLDVTAANGGALYAIGATVGASQKVALSGTIAVNHGGSDTEAVIGEAEDAAGNIVTKDKTTLTNVADTNVLATGSDTRVAAIGDFGFGGSVAVGGAVASNDVGGAGTGETGQKTRAAIVNTDLTTTDAGKVAVHAGDTSKLTTFSFGIGGSGNVAVQGSAATALVNKDITAEAKKSVIKAAAGGTTKDVAVTADSKSTVTTKSVVGALSISGAGGAGVSVARINQDTTASVTDSEITDTNTLVQATGNSDITTVGIGAAIAGNVAVSGNVAVNIIGNNVDASVARSTLTSTGNIGVLANGREDLGNYAGVVGLSATEAGAGIGISTSYNEINGTTAATVTDSSLKADGTDDAAVALTQSMDKDGVKTETKDGDQIVSDKRKGVVTAAYGQHDLESVAVTGGIGASPTVSGGVAGTITVNKIGGSTKATVTNTAINETRTAKANDDVTVQAKDRTDSESHVGSLSVGIGGAAGIGVAGAFDTLSFSRTTQAELSGNVSDPKNRQNKTVNGRTIDVTADQKSDVVTNADGLSISGGGTVAASAAASVAATKLDGTTKAVVDHISSTNDSLSVSALHDHHTTLVSASAAVAAAPVGAAVGAGIGVVNDDFTTAALIDQSSILSQTRTAVQADSSTEVDTYVIGVGASANVGAGATIAVNNLNSTTTAEVNGSAIGRARTTGQDQTGATTVLPAVTPDFTVDAHNRVTTKFDSVSAGGGFAAVGIGVGVNTVNTGTLAKVTDSTVYAKTGDVKAREELDVNQTLTGVTAGGIGVGTNIMVTTIGTTVATSYGQAGPKSGTIKAQDFIGKANGALDSQDENLEHQGKLINEDLGIKPTNDKTIKAGTGSKTAAGTQALVSNSTLTASDSLSVSADRQTDADITSTSANVAALGGLGVTVAVLDAQKDAGVTVSGKSALSAANNLTIQAKQHGTTAVTANQAAAADVASISAAFAQSKSGGTTNIAISGSSLQGGTTTLLAEDTGTTSSQVVGVTSALGFSGGALITNAENDSTTEVTLAGSTAVSNIGATTIRANKGNTSDAVTKGGAVGAAALQGIVAYAEDKGDSKITLTGANKISGKTVSIMAQGTPRVNAGAYAYNGALLGAVGASVATAVASGQVSLTAEDGSSFSGDSVTLSAATGQQADDRGKAYANAAAESIGGSAALAGSFQANVGDASQTTTVNVSVGNSLYNTGELSISGANSAALQASAEGVSVGAIASGENISEMTGTLTTTVSAAGAQAGSSLGSVAVRSSGYGNLDNISFGAGGGLVGISPTAAETDTTLTTDTQTDISGSWQAGSFTASATNSDDVDATADSFAAAVIGASGSEMTTKITHSAATNVTAAITTTGAQNYTAVNTVDHDVTLMGSGYGGATVNANAVENTLAYTAQVNLNKNTVLTGSGDHGAITALAATTGDMNYKNDLKSGGIVATTAAYSKNDLTYANSVNATEATLKTAKAGQDITLAATDNTYASFETIADTQGGGVGAATAETENTFHRSNTISLTKGLVESMNDVNLYAGADQNGIRSVLNYSAIADAYNKTIMPLASDPILGNTMTQTNHVDVNGEVRSVRHTNLKAAQGLTSVSESAREYNNYTGGAGTGSTTSTAQGTHTSSETTQNSVSIGSSGSITAGIHTDLDLTIDGKTKAATTAEGKPALDWSSIKATVNAGSEWFSADSVKPTSVTLTNTLMSRYNSLANVIGQYSPESNEYKVLLAEMKELKALMETNGFVKNGAILDEITVAAINLPDIVVSGGNIVIDSDAVSGTGSLTAQGAHAVSVLNRSDLYLKTGDVVIKDKGGTITYNDSTVGQSLSGFKGTLTSSTITGSEPSITIASTGYASDNTSPDIGVYGNIVNSTGDVTIKNANRNIYIVGSANVTGKTIHITADQGSVSQTSEGWLIAGADPITRYQFNDAIAQKIQKYISKAQTNGTNISWLTSQSSYESYRQALLAHAADLSLSDDEKNTISTYSADESAGIHAGSTVYLTGKNVILDGLVQSGYGTYRTVLTTEDQSRISALDAQWQRNRRALTDDQVMSNNAYLINGGAYYNSAKGQWEYEVKIFYNPATGKLLAENLEPSGGKIYITGAIASTNGSGRILALDGTPDITIDTSSVAKDLTLHKIENKDLEGLISIRDTNTNTLTEVTRKDQTVTVTTAAVDPKKAYDTSRMNASGTVYTPVAQTLKWTGGTAGDVKVTNYGYDTDFVFWGLIDYNTTADFVEKSGVDLGKAATSSQTMTGDQALAAGQVIAKGAAAADYSVATKVYTDEYTQWSRVSANKEYDGFWGEVLGYGTVKYRWSGSQNSSTSSTYSIKADHPITTGFISGGTDAISITANKDLSLDGTISSAGTGGTVTLQSTAGGISATGGASVLTDSLTASAAGTISLNHSALGTDAALSVKSTKGDVTVLSDKGNLNVTTGTAGGDLKLQADGNLTATGTPLSGKRIDLISRTGAIDAKANAAPAATSADTLAASLNADAAGNITLTNDNGNMRIGSIVSHNGNVSLTTSGSFEDATSGGELSGSADKLQLWQELGIISTDDAADSKTVAAAKAKADREAALTVRGNQLATASEGRHSVDDYDAAAQAYTAAAKGDADLQQAKSNYEKAVKTNAGDMEALQAAAAAYDAVRKQFLKDQGYTDFTEAEQDFILAASDIRSNTSYGWSQNDLLYAIQSSVLNASPKNEILTVEQANVKGHTITLNAARNIGTDGTPRTISYADLTKLENLQLLAQAKAGDLTWNAEAQTLTIRQQRPITIQLTGSANVNANTSQTTGAGSIYLAGVKNSALNVTGKISTTADVKLMADKGVTMDSGGITAKNLIVTGGTGDIGSAAKNLVTNLSGTLDARTDANLYIHQTGIGTDPARVLTIQNVGGKVVSLASDAGMKMTTEEGKTMGYIDGDVVTLTSANGALGLVTDGLRVKNSGVLNASANTDGMGVYIAGTGTGGTLTLKEITAGGDVVIDSEGTLLAGQEAVAQTETTAAKEAIDSQITGDNVTLKSVGAIRLNQGALNAGSVKDGKLVANSGTVTLNSQNAIAQTTNHGLQTPALDLSAGAGIDLRSNVAGTAADRKVNNVNTIELGNTKAAQDVYVHTANTQATAVHFKDGSTGNNVTIHNYGTGTAAGLSVTGNGTAATDLTLTNDAGSLSTTGTLTAGQDLSLTASGSVGTSAALLATRNVSLTGGTSITNAAAVTATKGSVNMTAQNAITQSGNVTAGTSLNIASEKEGNVTVTGNLKSGTTLRLAAKKGTLAVGTNKAANSIEAGTTATVLTTDGALTLYGNTKSVTGTTVETITSGDLTVTGNLDATGQGNVNVITATGDVKLTGNSKAGKAIYVHTTSGDITIDGTVTSDTPAPTQGQTNAILLALQQAGALPENGIHIDSTSGTITASGDFTGGTGGAAELVSQTGDIIYSGALSTGQGVLFQTQSGDITVGTAKTASSLTSTGATVTLETTGNTAQDKGDITLYGSAASVTGTTVKTNSLGNIRLEGSLKSTGKTGNVLVQTTNGTISLTASDNTVPVISSGNDATVWSTTSGGITVTGDITAAKAASLAAAEGNVSLTGNLTANGGAASVSASDKDVDAANADDLKGDIAITGNVISATDAVTVSTDNGNINLQGLTQSVLGTTVQTGSGDISVHGSLQTVAPKAGTKLAEGATQHVTVLTDSGDISLTAASTDTPVITSLSDAYVAANQTGDAKKAGDISVTGDIIAANTATFAAGEGSVSLTGNLTGTAGNAVIHASDSHKLAAAGNIVVDGNVTAKDLLNINTDNGTIMAGTEKQASRLRAGNMASVTTDNGDISLTGTVESPHGTTVETATTGDIVMTGDVKTWNLGDTSIEGTGDVLLQTASGAITHTGLVTATGAAALQTTSGNIVQTGDVRSGTTTDVQAQAKGHVEVYGNIDSGTATTLYAAQGSISQTGQHITAGTALTAAASEGSLSLDSDLTSQNGDTVLLASDSADTAAAGNILVTGTVQALKGNLQAETDNGDIEFAGPVSADQDLSTRTGKGNILFRNNLWSGASLTGETATAGSITLDGTAQAAGNIALQAGKQGTITLRKDVTAGIDTAFGTNDGDILFEGTSPGQAEDIHVTAQTGNVAMTTSGTGDIKDSHGTPGGDRAYIAADTGNITIRHEGTGNVDIQSLYAKKDAGVEIKDGSLYLNDIDGNLVALFVRNPDKVMDVGHITAGTQIAISGSDIGLDNVSQRLGSDGFLTITPNGASDDQPIETLAIGELRTNTGARFDHLWLRNGSIKATQGQLQLDKLYILDKASFSNGIMDTHIYGTTPIADPASTSTYWNNTKRNNPRTQLTSWLDNTTNHGRDGAWQYLRFEDRSHTQYSNGNLLQLNPHNYVYNERYTLTNWMSTQQDADHMNTWQQAYHPALTYTERYNLVNWEKAIPTQENKQETK